MFYVKFSRSVVKSFVNWKNAVKLGSVKSAKGNPGRGGKN